MWVLAKVELRVMRLPAWGEQIAIETWGKGIDRFYALRDFAVHSTDGRKIASSASAWMILDKSSYRPQKLEQIKMDFPWVPGRHEIETELKKVPPVGSDVERSRFDVRYTDLDVNKHVTAARYLQWMLDSYPTAELEAHEPRSIEINYLAEARMGDQVSVCYERQQGFDLCVVSRALDHKELCRARIEWTSS